MDIEQFLPDRTGYAEFGYQQPVWEKQLYNKQPHTKSNVKTYTCLSTSTTQYGGPVLTGGNNWTKIPWQFRNSDGSLGTSTGTTPLDRDWETGPPY